MCIYILDVNNLFLTIIIREVSEMGFEYDLAGVVNHMGTLNGGHYTA